MNLNLNLNFNFSTIWTIRATLLHNFKILWDLPKLIKSSKFIRLSWEMAALDFLGLFQLITS